MHSYRESVAHVFYEKPANFSDIGWWLLKKSFSNVVKNGWYAPFSLRNEHNSNDSAIKTSLRHRITKKLAKKSRKAAFLRCTYPFCRGRGSCDWNAPAPLVLISWPPFDLYDPRFQNFSRLLSASKGINITYYVKKQEGVHPPRWGGDFLRIPPPEKNFDFQN